MITPEERESIILEAIERALLLLPDTMARLMVQQKNVRDLSAKFYKDHPEFVKHKELVGRTVEKTEAEMPGVDYSKVLERAAGKLKKRVHETKTLDLTKVERPSQLNLPDLGEL